MEHTYNINALIKGEEKETMINLGNILGMGKRKNEKEDETKGEVASYATQQVEQLLSLMDFSNIIVQSRLEEDDIVLTKGTYIIKGDEA